MIIREVETKEEAIECNKLLTKLIDEEKEYNDNIKDDLIITDWFQNLYLKEDKLLLIALDNKKVVAYIYIKIKNDDTNKYKEALLDGIYVLEEYRNNGIATLLINKAKSWCINNNIKYLSLNVSYQNEIARKLYQKNGFKEFYINLKCDL